VIGLFLFGCFITAIVAAACFIVITGIREDQRDRARLSEEAGEDIKV
jgi:hypothetical protein